MGLTDNRKLGSICDLANSKLEERVDKRRGTRSRSVSGGATPRQGTGKLHKSPQVRAVSEKPRNRLRKQIAPTQTQTKILHVDAYTARIDIFVLEYEPYPHSVEPGKVLGIYSTFDSVTSGAFAYGAYTFSREGLLDGNEYLSTTGRIKLVRTTVQRNGVRALFPEHSESPQDGHIRLDIPHPESQQNNPSEVIPTDEKMAGRDTVFLAIRAGPRVASWIGVFADVGLAWGACLKDKAMCAVLESMCDEVRSIGDNNMPQISGRLVGSGRFTWKVEEHVVDDSKQTPRPTVRDL